MPLLRFGKITCIRQWQRSAHWSLGTSDSTSERSSATVAAGRTPQSREPWSKRSFVSFRWSGAFQTAKSAMYTGRRAVAHQMPSTSRAAAPRLTGMSRISAR